MSDYWSGFSKDENYTWYVGIGLDLSYFVSSDSRINKASYDKNLADLDAKRMELDTQRASYLQFFSVMRHEAEERKMIAQSMFETYKEKRDQIELLHEIGTVNTIEVLFYEMKELQMKNAVSDAEDDVWLYKWAQNNT